MMLEKHGHLLIPQDMFRECEILFMHFHNVCIFTEPLNKTLAKLKATETYHQLGKKWESILCSKPTT